MPDDLIAVVPARRDSKRLPGKNFLSLEGRTLVERAVDVGLQTKGINRVFVDTDSPELRRLGLDSGAEVPYLRPEHLSHDYATTGSVLLNLLDHLWSVEGYKPEAIVLLQPTSPLRTPADVSAGVRVWREYPDTPIASVCLPLQSPRHLLAKHPSGPWKYALDVATDVSFAFEDGAVYVTPVQYLRSTGEVFRPSEGRTFEISPLHGVDIDELFQFETAKALFPLTKHHLGQVVD